MYLIFYRLIYLDFFKGYLSNENEPFLKRVHYEKKRKQNKAIEKFLRICYTSLNEKKLLKLRLKLRKEVNKLYFNDLT